MKKIILSLILLTNYAFAQVKNGEPVSEINFATILNAPVKNIKLSQLKGKLVLLEFWATWCGSCLEAMPHLKQLQERYPNALQVITVTDETAKRAGQYLTARPSNLWFAVDTAGTIAKLFPHQLIPHTVLISANGKLIANTNPEGVTEAVIDSLLNKRAVHLAEKRDIIISAEDVIDSVFFAANTVDHRFIIQPAIKGVQGLSTAYLTDSIFNGRRITAINCDLLALYRIAYGNFPYKRIIDRTFSKQLPAYCLDIIVKNKSDLLPELQMELLKRFDVQARLESQLKDVYVLKVSDPDKLKLIPINTSGKRTYYARHGEIDQQNITMADLAAYLESYGTGHFPVVNETNINNKFDIKFSFEPENPQSLAEILKHMGLGLVKEQREIEILLFYKR